MATYPLSFPTKALVRERLQLNHRQAAMESPHTYAMQVVNTASQWTLEFAWPRMRHAEAQAIAAWLNSLRGQVGTFRYSPRNSVKSSITGRTLAAVGHGYATSVRVAGWSANAFSGLSLGQYFSIGDQLLQITAVAARADANGQVLVDFEPMLRTAFAVGTEVNFANPSGVFRLISADGAAFNLDPDRLPEFPAIQAKEAI